MRRTFISTTWTPDVDPEDARTLMRTLEIIYSLLRHHLGRPGQFDPLPVVRVFGAWSIADAPRNAAYNSMEWYLERCLDDTQQHVLASRFVDTVQLEPWQMTNPHFDLCLTDRPIVDDLERPGDPVVLGFSRGGLVSLISTEPFVDIVDPDLRQLAMGFVFAHYFGRLIDIPLVTRTDDVEQVAGETFCTSVCAMRRVSSPEQALDYAREQIATGTVYCEPCQHDLVAQITSFHYGVN